jgi:hypothetical protein
MSRKVQVQARAYSSIDVFLRDQTQTGSYESYSGI